MAILMKVLITGGAGFIGKWLVRSLPPAVEIVIVDSIDAQAHRETSDFSPWLKQRAHCIKADINDKQAYADAVEGTDVVVHLASQTGTGQSMYEIARYAQQNVEGTAKLLEVVSRLKQKPQRIVLTSSRAVYGEGVAIDRAGGLHNTVDFSPVCRYRLLWALSLGRCSSCCGRYGAVRQYF